MPAGDQRIVEDDVVVGQPTDAQSAGGQVVDRGQPAESGAVTGDG
jgi:hypothetical protein